MSVAGFDIGNDTSCIAIARKRGIDVLLNKESKRETPAVVNFGEKMRFLGTDGSAKQGLSPQNTVAELKRLIGRKFSDPIVQADLARHPFKVSEGPDGGCLITVMFQNEQQTFTPEQVMAMILVDLKKISEAETGVPPVDCVVTVPVYFNEAQRYAMINAAQIAGLNVLRLMNENTATALAYGIFKTDLPETEPVHVAFVDVGHSATQVSIVSLRKGGLQVKAHTWDDSLGGRDFDELLFEHFAAEFKAKNKIDIKSNKKASFKLRTSCEKVKKMLSANAEAPLNIECIMEDTDVRGMMDRERFEALGETHSARFKGVLEKAIAQSGLTTEQISSVEVVGSSVRIPMLARLVESVFGKIASRTLNAKECVSRGAALQCAMLSPVFKVREFEVIDACPYNIDFVWDKDGKTTSQRLFERGSPFPAAKMLTFLRAQPFNITAVCADTGETLGQYAVGPFTPPAGSDVAKLKVKVRMNMHGLVSVESVQAIEEEEEAAPAAAAPTAADTPMADAAAAGPQPEAAAAADGAAPAANGDQPAPMETDAAAAAAAAAPAAADAAAAAKKRKVKRSDVPFAVSGVAGYDQKQLDLYFEKEAQMQAADHLQEETADRKNAVEAYLYKLRNALYGPLEAFVREAEKEAVLAKLQATEDWLYEEGEDCTKSVYVAKLEELKTMGGPIEQRAAEQEARPAAAAALRSAAEGYLSWASSTEPRFSHITPEERQPVANEAKAALDWLSEKQALQAQLSKADPPVLLAADCNKKCEVLERLARPIVNKPPPPKPAPASPPKPADAAAAQAPQQEAAAGVEPAAAAAGAEGGAAPMDSEGGSEGIPPLEPMQP